MTIKRVSSGCLAAVSLLALACAPAAAPTKVLGIADPWPTSSPESWECPRDLDKAERDERGIQWPGVKGACDSCTTSGGQWVPERYMPDVGPHGLQRLAWSCAQCYRTARSRAGRLTGASAARCGRLAGAQRGERSGFCVQHARQRCRGRWGYELRR